MRIFHAPLIANECPIPLLSVGGGHVHAGSHHSGSFVQVEYQWGQYLWWRIRPQAILIAPEIHSLFFGLGIGFEFYFKESFVITPNFSPGLYYQGGWRNLGLPLEFRSCLDVAYELRNKVRVGGQISHISNASISSKNPGANFFAFFVSFPLKGH